jgi:hypothetical protein
MKLFGVIVCGIGIFIIGSQSWVISLGVAVMIWGYELQLRPPEVE